MTGSHTERFERLLGVVTGDPDVDLSKIRVAALRDFGAEQSGTLASRTFAVNGFDFDLSCGCSALSSELRGDKPAYVEQVQ